MPFAQASHALQSKLTAFCSAFRQLQSRIDREDFPETRVEWSEFVNFHRVLRSLNDVHYALETFSSTESVGKIDR